MVLWYGFLTIETTQANYSNEQHQQRKRKQINKCSTFDNIYDNNRKTKIFKSAISTLSTLSSSSSSSTNSWIYTEELKKRFEERYLILDDLQSFSTCPYIIIPVYCERIKLRTTSTKQNSWIYTKSLREQLVTKQQLFNNRHSLLSLFDADNSTYCTNHGYNNDRDDCSSTKVKKSRTSFFRTSMPNLSFWTRKKGVMLNRKLTEDLVEEENEDATNTEVSLPLIENLSLTTTMSHLPLPVFKQPSKMTCLRKLFFKSLLGSKSKQDNQTIIT
ncbi:unnamed protein product [Didymodactylos carnosus]|uniref:Uncharacterized protein n=1 Tax=Didymodactylos carnosus TaxID=1234261 RepID=A0A8S2GEE6_9BILA|nr:unnamed protein product [Didymodactylos carnosus]CAF3501810.1 unnamed protein product [Didymodactylos carnosus]